MPAPPRIEVDGLNQLKRDLRRIGDVDLKSKLVDANRGLARDVVDAALPNVPVRTGRLKASVRGLGNAAGAVGKAGSTSVPYAAAIHWGRKQGGVIPARPFLYDAAKHIEATIEDRYRDAIDPVFDAVRAYD